MCFDHFVFNFCKTRHEQIFQTRNTKDPELFQARAHDSRIMINIVQTPRRHLFMHSNLLKVTTTRTQRLLKLQVTKIITIFNPVTVLSLFHNFVNIKIVKLLNLETYRFVSSVINSASHDCSLTFLSIHILPQIGVKVGTLLPKFKFVFFFFRSCLLSFLILLTFVTKLFMISPT